MVRKRWGISGLEIPERLECCYIDSTWKKDMEWQKAVFRNGICQIVWREDIYSWQQCPGYGPGSVAEVEWRRATGDQEIKKHSLWWGAAHRISMLTVVKIGRKAEGFLLNNKCILYLKGSDTSSILVSSFSHYMEWQVERSLKVCSRAHGSECSGRFGAFLMGARPWGGNAGMGPSHLCTTH